MGVQVPPRTPICELANHRHRRRRLRPAPSRRCRFRRRQFVLMRQTVAAPKLTTQTESKPSVRPPPGMGHREVRTRRRPPCGCRLLRPPASRTRQEPCHSPTRSHGIQRHPESSQLTSAPCPRQVIFASATRRRLRGAPWCAKMSGALPGSVHNLYSAPRIFASARVSVGQPPAAAYGLLTAGPGSPG